jgi:hypothetical protein
MADDTRAPQEERRETIRERIMATIPESYRPWLHLAMTTGVGAAVLGVGAVSITALKPIELLVVPAVVVLANGVEWRAHKDLLHRRVKPLHELYDRHTPQHHMAFQTDDMAIRSFKELRLVLIPSIGVAAIVVGMLGPSFLVGSFLGANVGWLFLMTSGAYVVLYELTHLSYHLPPESFIGRLGIVRFLRAHHAKHHDPKLMQKWNFNVTLPLFDWLHGTIAPADAREKAASIESPEPRPAGL